MEILLFYICTISAVAYFNLLRFEFEVEFINGVLLHMQRYFSHKSDGTDVQVD